MASLDRQSLSSLATILESNSSLETIAAQFHRAFPHPQQFKAASALALMLEDPAALLPAARLTAFFILFDINKSEPPGANPFVPVFLRHSKRSDAPPAEVALLRHLICHPPRELSRRTPQELLQSVASLASPPESQIVQVERTFFNLLDRPSLPNSFLLASVPPSIPDPDPSASTGEREPSPHEGTLLGLEPPWHRPLPPSLPFDMSELHWIEPTLQHPFLWDDSGDSDRGEQSVIAMSATVREVMSKAFKHAIPAVQQQEVLQDLDANPKLIFHCGLSPRRFPELVENNPIFAFECMLKLMGSSQIQEYFDALLGMPMSLHSMEVVNRLTTAVELPPGFVQVYISHCIHSCESIKERYVQNRLVRLLCVFLQSLIRNKIINVKSQKDLFVEVQAFCIDFSKIKEAAGLFRLLKTLQ